MNTNKQKTNRTKDLSKLAMVADDICSNKIPFSLQGPALQALKKRARESIENAPKTTEVEISSQSDWETDEPVESSQVLAERVDTPKFNKMPPSPQMLAQKTLKKREMGTDQEELLSDISDLEENYESDESDELEEAEKLLEMIKANKRNAREIKMERKLIQKMRDEMTTSKKDTHDKLEDYIKKNGTIVKFNVGGKHFFTRVETIKKSTFLSELVTNPSAIKMGDMIFIDKDPDYFCSVMRYLRTCAVNKKDITKEFLNQSKYYGIAALTQKIEKKIEKRITMRGKYQIERETSPKPKKKRKKNGYLYFKKHEWSRIGKKYNFGEKSKIIGARWKTMTKEQKKPYVTQAKLANE